jgi:hypothetical protein
MSSKKSTHESETSESSHGKTSVIIGITESSQELRFDSELPPETITEIAKLALQEQGIFELKDLKGRIFLVPVNKISYIQIGDGSELKVGFTAF